MKRYISLLLTLCMVLTLLQVPLFAEEDTSAPVTETPAEEDIVLEETAPTDPEGSADEPLLPNVEEPVVETLSGTVVATGSCGDDLIWALDDAGMLTIEGEGLISGKSYALNRIYELGVNSARNFVTEYARLTGTVVSIG